MALVGRPERMAERPAEGAEVAEEAVSIFERLGDQEAADNARYLLAGLYRMLGDRNSALAAYRELIERLEDNPAGRGQIAAPSRNPPTNGTSASLLSLTA